MTMFLTNKYAKWYFSIINNAKSRTLNNSIYVERHHIIPDCFYKLGRNKSGWLDGSPNDSANVVTLTAKEHFICHLLLPKITTGKAKYKMINALLRTAIGFNADQQYIITSRIYELVRKQYSDMRKGQVGWNKGKDLSEYITKAGILYSPWNKGKSTSAKGKTYDEIYGLEKSAEMRRLRSISLLGSIKSDKTKAIWSTNRKGKTNGALNANAKAVTINGVTYPCKLDAMAALNISLYKLNKLLIS